MKEKLLLVEDESVFAVSQAQRLKTHGYTTLIVHRGEEAVETVKNDPEISLVLMDIELGPGMDGAETAARILELKELPIVFFTAYDDESMVNRVKDLTRYGYILKSSGTFVLIGTIEMALRLFNSHIEVKKRETEQRELLQRLQRYERIVHNTKELISETDENNRFTYMNKRHEEVLGYRTEELLGTSPAELLHPDDLKRAVERHQEIREETGSSVDRWRFRCKDGSYRCFECRGTVYHDQEGRKSTIVISHDITEQLKTQEALEESEDRFKSFMNHLPGAAFIKNDKKVLLYCNELYATMSGNRPEELIGSTGREKLPEAVQRQYDEENRKVLSEKQVILSESTFPCEGRDTHWLTYKFPLVSKGETLLGAVSIDITARKEAENQAHAALEAKELLMKEMQHRVKNNFLMVESLLRLKESSERSDFSEILRQIEAIRMVHEDLYHVEDLSRIDFAAYCGDLISNIFAYCPFQPVTIRTPVAPIHLTTKTAMTLGLIINEIATNAIKHGFIEGEEASFFIALKKGERNNDYTLTISNSGRPFPEEVSIEKAESTGLQLIVTLVEQLGGRLDLQRSPTPVFSIDFSAANS